MMKQANRVTGPLGVGFLLLALLATTAEARSNFDQSKICYLGVRGGAMLPQSDLDGKVDRHGVAFLRYGLMPKLHAELGVGYGRYTTEHYDWECADVILPGEQHPRCRQSTTNLDTYWTHLSYVQLRLLWAPVTFQSWAPYLYGGGAYTYFNVETITPRRGPFSGIERTLGIPVGAGARFELSEKVGLEASGGYTFTRSDLVDEVDDGGAKDHYVEFMLGLTYDFPCLPRRAKPPVPVVVPDELVDTDGDGLTDHEERTIDFTNPLMWDSDGDGLSDGEEVHIYGTNPNKADTDGGGIPDAPTAFTVGFDTQPPTITSFVASGATLVRLPTVLARVSDDAAGVRAMTGIEVSLGGRSVTFAFNRASGEILVVTPDLPAELEIGPTTLVIRAQDGFCNASEVTIPVLIAHGGEPGQVIHLPFAER